MLTSTTMTDVFRTSSAAKAIDLYTIKMTNERARAERYA
jgi:hypothetical protein